MSAMEISEFITRCDAYCANFGVSRVWLSKRLFSDTNRLNDLASGESDIGVKRMSRAVNDLADLNHAAQVAKADKAA